METITENNALVRVLETSGIEKTKGELVLEKFQHFFTQASEWESKVKALVITDPTQLREMKMAREGRLALRDIRINANKTREKLKEASLIEGRFIQSIYNVIEGVIAPLENELLEKEKFVENLEKERIAKLKAERVEALSPHVVNVEHYWLEGMSDSEFADLLKSSKDATIARIEAERKAEQEKIEKEKAESAERERIRLENERLKAEAAEKEKALDAERLAHAKEALRLKEEREAIEAKARAEKNAADLEAKKKQAEADAKFQKEREAREKLEAEKREAAAKIVAENKAKIEAEKKAAKAPDKAKLLNLVEQIKAIQMPELKTVDASDIAFYAKKELEKTINWIISQTESL